MEPILLTENDLVFASERGFMLLPTTIDHNFASTDANENNKIIETLGAQFFKQTYDMKPQDLYPVDASHNNCVVSPNGTAFATTHLFDVRTIQFVASSKEIGPSSVSPPRQGSLERKENDAQWRRRARPREPASIHTDDDDVDDSLADDDDEEEEEEDEEFESYHILHQNNNNNNDDEPFPRNPTLVTTCATTTSTTTKISRIETKSQTKYGFTGRITCLTFSHDSSLLAAGCGDKNVIVWEVESNRNYSVFKEHTEPVTCLSFRNDDKVIASGTNDGTILVWHVVSQEVLHFLKPSHGPNKRVMVCDFSPLNNHILLVHVFGEKLALWALDSGVVDNEEQMEFPTESSGEEDGNEKTRCQIRVRRPPVEFYLLGTSYEINVAKFAVFFDQETRQLVSRVFAASNIVIGFELPVEYLTYFNGSNLFDLSCSSSCSFVSKSNYEKARKISQSKNRTPDLDDFSKDFYKKYVPPNDVITNTANGQRRSEVRCYNLSLLVQSTAKTSVVAGRYDVNIVIWRMSDASVIAILQGDTGCHFDFIPNPAGFEVNRFHKIMIEKKKEVTLKALSPASVQDDKVEEEEEEEAMLSNMFLEDFFAKNNNSSSPTTSVQLHPLHLLARKENIVSTLGFACIRSGSGHLQLLGLEHKPLKYCEFVLDGVGLARLDSNHHNNQSADPWFTMRETTGKGIDICKNSNDNHVSELEREVQNQRQIDSFHEMLSGFPTPDNLETDSTIRKQTVSSSPNQLLLVSALKANEQDKHGTFQRKRIVCIDKNRRWILATLSGSCDIWLFVHPKADPVNANENNNGDRTNRFFQNNKKPRADSPTSKNVPPKAIARYNFSELSKNTPTGTGNNNIYQDSSSSLMTMLMLSAAGVASAHTPTSIPSITSPSRCVGAICFLDNDTANTHAPLTSVFTSSSVSYFLAVTLDDNEDSVILLCAVLNCPPVNVEVICLMRRVLKRKPSDPNPFYANSMELVPKKCNRNGVFILRYVSEILREKVEIVMCEYEIDIFDFFVPTNVSSKSEAPSSRWVTSHLSYRPIVRQSLIVMLESLVKRKKFKKTKILLQEFLAPSLSSSFTQQQNAERIAFVGKCLDPEKDFPIFGIERMTQEEIQRECNGNFNENDNQNGDLKCVNFNIPITSFELSEKVVSQGPKILKEFERLFSESTQSHNNAAKENHKNNQRGGKESKKRTSTRGVFPCFDKRINCVDRFHTLRSEAEFALSRQFFGRNEHTLKKNRSDSDDDEDDDVDKYETRRNYDDDDDSDENFERINFESHPETTINKIIASTTKNNDDENDISLSNWRIAIENLKNSVEQFEKCYSSTHQEDNDENDSAETSIQTIIIDKIFKEISSSTNILLANTDSSAANSRKNPTDEFQLALLLQIVDHVWEIARFTQYVGALVSRLRNSFVRCKPIVLASRDAEREKSELVKVARLAHACHRYNMICILQNSEKNGNEVRDEVGGHPFLSTARTYSWYRMMLLAFEKSSIYQNRYFSAVAQPFFIRPSEMSKRSILILHSNYINNNAIVTNGLPAGVEEISIILNNNNNNNLHNNRGVNHQNQRHYEDLPRSHFGLWRRCVVKYEAHVRHFSTKALIHLFDYSLPAERAGFYLESKLRSVLKGVPGVDPVLFECVVPTRSVFANVQEEQASWNSLTSCSSSKFMVGLVVAVPYCAPKPLTRQNLSNSYRGDEAATIDEDEEDFKKNVFPAIDRLKTSTIPQLLKQSLHLIRKPGAFYDLIFASRPTTTNTKEICFNLLNLKLLLSRCSSQESRHQHLSSSSFCVYDEGGDSNNNDVSSCQLPQQGRMRISVLDVVAVVLGADFVAETIDELVKLKNENDVENGLVNDSQRSNDNNDKQDYILQFKNSESVHDDEENIDKICMDYAESFREEFDETENKNANTATGKFERSEELEMKIEHYCRKFHSKTFDVIFEEAQKQLKLFEEIVARNI